MTKEEKIKEAWKSNFDEFSEYINSDGWAIYPHFQKHEMTEDVRPIEFKINGLGFRPKSLHGIENNNGWIKIESEDDLPKDYGNYHVKYLNGQSIAWFNDGFFYTMKGNKFKDNHITHYQPINRPLPPIY